LLLAGALEGLRTGSIIVIDISLLSSAAGNMLAGLMLRRIFSHNQENFTAGGKSSIIPVIAVVEEAQGVLGRYLDETSPFVEWVKEGRKYELGAVLVTQQPGSMAPEILSQADNWFCFHLLSEGDAETLGRYNSYYSSDVLAHLIAEPIAGNCFMWSAPHQPFVLPVRVRDFELLYKKHVVAAESGLAPTHETRAAKIRQQLSERVADLAEQLLGKLREGGVKYVRIPDALAFGVEGVGVLSGQLYYLIQAMKPAAETQTEERLKRVLMNEIFGEGVAQVKKHSNGKEYYCASLAEWTRALGNQPKVTSL